MLEGICTSPEKLWCMLWGGSVIRRRPPPQKKLGAIEKYYLVRYEV